MKLETSKHPAVLSLNELCEIIVSRRTCKIIIDARFDSLIKVLKTNLDSYKHQFKNNIKIIKLLDSNFVFYFNYIKNFRLQREQNILYNEDLIDEELNQIAHEVGRLNKMRKSNIDHIKQIISLINQYYEKCKIIFDNKTLVFYQYERITRPGFFGGVFMLNAYLDDGEMEFFRVMGLTGTRNFFPLKVRSSMYEQILEVNDLIV